MPKITAQGRTFECAQGTNLRRALLAQGIDLYSPRAAYINCMGLGTCGTCAVAIEGKVSNANLRDRTRRSLPPHQPDKPLRLACQTQVLGDIRVTKYKGFWGHESEMAWKPEDS